MQITKTFFLFILCFEFCCCIYPQQNSNTFLPLDTGNIYNYSKNIKRKFNYFVLYPKTISCDTILAGKKYYYFSFFGSYVRYDDSLNAVLTYDNGAECGNLFNERIIEKFNCDINDTVKFCNDKTGDKVLLSKDSVSFYGEKYEAVTFKRISDGWQITYAKGIGVFSYSYIAGNDTNEFILSTCRIGNNYYGKPGDFFPNPFSPSSTIYFILSHPQEVNIKIFDVSGIEIYNKTDFRSTGDNSMDYYKVLNDFPSGRYFIKISSEENTLRKYVYFVR